MQIKIEVPKLHKIISALDKYPTVAAKHINKVIRDSIFEIERGSKINTPVDTGYLRNSQVSRFEPLKGIYTVSAEYGAYVEFGTKFMKAQPYLVPAIEDSESNISGRFDKALENTLNEIAGSI